MSTKSDIAELRNRIEELEKTCRVQTDTLVCALLIIGEFAQMTKGVIDRNCLDMDTFTRAKDLLEENMGWLEEHGMTDNNFPLAGSSSARVPRKIHLKLVVDNKDCSGE